MTEVTSRLVCGLCVVLFQNPVDLGLCAVDLVVEVLGGNTLGPVAEGDELSVEVRPANGCKCGRCWKVLHSVKAVGEHEALCPRCAAVMAKLPKVE